ncbi:hypothetical protein JCM8097_002204 [Rhodosporidiobolus ruineniae]
MSSVPAAPRPSMLDKLPEELLDMIVERTYKKAKLKDPGDYYTNKVNATLRSICLTCRALLNPVGANSTGRPSRDVAYWFLRDLTARPDLLGLVRDLEGMAVAVDRYSADEVDFSSSAASRAFDPYRFQADLIRSCPTNSNLYVHIPPPKLVHDLVSALGSSSKPLEQLGFRGVDAGDRLMMRYTRRFRLNLDFPSLLPSHGDPPRPSYTCTHLEIVAPSVSHITLLAFLPADLAPLRNLRLVARTGPASVEVLCEALAGNQIEDFHLKGEAIDAFLTRDLVQVSHGTHLPSMLFQTFPSLRILTLSDCHSLSFDNLATLAASSPNLESLNFPKSVWHGLAVIDFVAPPSGGLSPGETLFRAALQRFAKLKVFDAGILPLRKGSEAMPKQKLPIEDIFAAEDKLFKWVGCRRRHEWSASSDSDDGSSDSESEDDSEDSEASEETDG